jgi:hypothetical protein
MANRRNNNVYEKSLGIRAICSGSDWCRGNTAYEFGPGRTLFEHGSAGGSLRGRPAPRSGYVYSSGHWQHDGSQYVWSAGDWQAARPGYTYSQPTWVENNGRYAYQPSRWDRDGDAYPIVAQAPNNPYRN